MLVLTREVGQSIIINESTIITVTINVPGFAELFQLDTISGQRRIVTLALGEQLWILTEVAVVLIRQPENKVRLGFEYPRHISIRRGEDPFD